MLRSATIGALKQVSVLIEIIIRQPSGVGGSMFSEARIGAHIRHVHDHFQAFLEGLDTGIVDYNQRNRDSPAEKDIALSDHVHQTILTRMSSAALTHRALFIISEIDCFASENTELPSTIDRELLYLINHTIHHVAIIKLVLQHRGIAVPDYLGVAPSTASHLRSLKDVADRCAQ